MNSETVTVHKSSVPFLRYQVRGTAVRAEQMPIWRQRRIVGLTHSGDTVRVIHLLGFGRTEEAARKMARRTVARYKKEQ